MSFEELRESLDIVEVIGTYISLKRVGSNYVGLCPFHPDKNPSLSVSPSLGIWKCFGCNEGGDVIKFVSLYEGISYVESARLLAKKYNLPFNYGGEEKKIYGLLEKVLNLYRRELLKSKEAQSYLRERGISNRSIDRFSLGYCPSSETLLEELSEGELRLYAQTGNIRGVRDLFEGRIVIPIRGLSGKVLGFGGRILGEGSPKYVNSPESSIFKKGKVLFNLNEAFKYAREEGYFILVEGFFDVISLFDKNVRNVVASLGTSLTLEQAKLMKKFAKGVILIPDSDEAGRLSLRKNAKTLISLNMEVKVCSLEGAKDPDQFVRDFGVKAFLERLRGSEEIFNYLLKELEGGKEEAYEELLLYLSHLPDPLKKKRLALRISQITGYPLSHLKERMENLKVLENGKSPIRSKKEFYLLKGLLELKVDLDLDKLQLRPIIYNLAKEIMRGNLEGVPEEVVRGRVKGNLKELFLKAIEELSKPRVNKRLRR